MLCRGTGVQEPHERQEGALHHMRNQLLREKWAKNKNTCKGEGGLAGRGIRRQTPEKVQCRSISASEGVATCTFQATEKHGVVHEVASLFAIQVMYMEQTSRTCIEFFGVTKLILILGGRGNFLHKSDKGRSEESF